MKRYERTMMAVLLALFGTAMAGWVLTRPAPSGTGQGASRLGSPAPTASQSSVDQEPFSRAQQLASLAGSPEEQNLARLAITLADQELDLAFAAALRNAASHPAPLRPAAQRMQQHVQEVAASVAADKSEVARLSAQVAHAEERRKDQVSMQLELAQAQQALDEDQLADAEEDLARAGGNPQRDIQQQMAEHEATQQHTSSTGAGTGTSTGNGEPTTSAAAPTVLPEAAGAPPRNIVALVGDWSQLRSGEKELRDAQQDSLALVATLTNGHEQLEQEVSSEEPQRSALAQQATHDLATGGQGAEQTAADALASAHHLSEDQKNLADFDKRIQAAQHLSNVYARWANQVASRRRATVHSLLWYVGLVLLIAFAAIAAEVLLSALFAKVEPERKRLHTLRAVAQIVVRATGAVLILLVVFGPPNQLATVVALAGAGLTVALKDFIVGFFGWFVLLGNNGIRPGDWVEINGVPGEVLEVGLLHTILLETGEGAGASRPTGRKVTFVNSFAIEGHYFNFTTGGRWIWDELQVSIPSGSDPFPIAEAIQKLVERETEGSAKLAEQEWQHVSSNHRPSFSAAPTLSVKPDSKGAVISVRYLTGAGERHALSERLYRGVVQMLHERKIPDPSSGPAWETPPAPAAEARP